MNHDNLVTWQRTTRLGGAALLLLALVGCSVLRPTTTPQPTFYALDGASSPQAPAAPVVPAANAPTLIVSPPRAAAGFDSQRIMYVREAHKLEYFANSEWVDPPARMLAPLMAGALERTGAFRAVVLTPSGASAELRLDTELVRLQQDFQTRPSQVRFTLRAWLVEDKSRRVLAWREFDATLPAPNDDPYGGVVAANRVVQSAVRELALFCSDAARGISAPVASTR